MNNPLKNKQTSKQLKRGGKEKKTTGPSQEEGSLPEETKPGVIKLEEIPE